MGGVWLLLCLLGLTACGHSDPSRVIARVAGRPIREATVFAWAAAIQSGSAAGPADAPAHASTQEKALSYLIQARWLIGETGERGIGPSRQAVHQGVSERIEAAPGGRGEFQGSSAKQTLSGLDLEVEVELAEARLRAMVSSGVAAVTHAEVAADYREHRAIFHVRQRRHVDLVENLPSRSAAIALGRRLGTGRRFAARATHEFVSSTPQYEAHTPKFNTGLLRAIFAARPGELTGPVAFNNAWTLLVVRRVEPGEYIALPLVEALIVKRIREEHRRAALARFTGPYLEKWRARTSCSAGFVVPGCREYRGTVAEERVLGG